MIRALYIIPLLIMVNSPGVHAQEAKSCSGEQLGTWRLQSLVQEDVETGQKSNVLGMNPDGYISYGSDCRMNAMLLQEGRTPPTNLVPSDSEKIELFSGFIAYAGFYSIEGNRVSHHIDASWNQAWTGTTQVRLFNINGDLLHIKTVPAPTPLTGREVVTTLVWKKIE